MLNTALYLSHRIIVPFQLSVLAGVSPGKFSFASISTFKTPERLSHEVSYCVLMA